MSEPSAPAKSLSTGNSTIDNLGGVGRLSAPSSPATSTLSTAATGARGAGGATPLKTINDALAYIKLAKDTFNNDQDKYRNFLDLFMIFLRRTIDMPGLITRLKELFEGHPELVSGINEFLPERYAIMLSDDEDSSLSSQSSVSDVS